jgi:hypothetical protein
MLPSGAMRRKAFGAKPCPPPLVFASAVARSPM